MTKKFIFIAAILGLSFISSYASALTFSGEKGASIVINATNVANSSPLRFEPSAQVNMAGGSEATCFAVIGGHDAVKGKEAGQNYGMAADSSNVFWIAAPATFPTTFADTNSTTISTWNRN